jgi:hypothetical protein
VSGFANTADLGATADPRSGEGYGARHTLTRLRRTQNADVGVEGNENGTSTRVEPEPENEWSRCARPDFSGDGSVMAVVEEVRQARMLPARAGGVLLDVVRALLLILTLRPSGILGGGALGGPVLSPRISQRCQHRYRAHESKKHHRRR